MNSIFRLQEAKKIADNMLLEMVYNSMQTPPEFFHTVKYLDENNEVKTTLVKARNFIEAAHKARQDPKVKTVISS